MMPGGALLALTRAPGPEECKPLPATSVCGSRSALAHFSLAQRLDAPFIALEGRGDSLAANFQGL